MVNAGYSLEEVQEALNELSGRVSVKQSQEIQQTQEIQYPSPAQEAIVSSISPKTSQTQKKKSSIDSVFIMLIIFLLLIISGGITLALFWDNFMSLFGL